MSGKFRVKTLEDGMVNLEIETVFEGGDPARPETFGFMMPPVYALWLARQLIDCGVAGRNIRRSRGSSLAGPLVGLEGIDEVAPLTEDDWQAVQRAMSVFERQSEARRGPERPPE